MRKYTRAVLALTILSLAVAFCVVVDNANAVPAFARKYRMSCTTCHQPFPRLKPYGDEFAGNGFNLKDKDAPRYFMETGDQNLSLIRELPLAIRLEGFVKHQTATGRETDFSTPYNLKLISGGALADHVSYYFYFFLSERGEVAGVEDAFIMFNDLFGQDLDLYIGQFQVSDPLFKREVRLEYEDYNIYTVTPGESKIDLKYDRGFMITYGLPTGTDIVVELTNGNGIGGADEDYKTYDTDKYKNILGRISQDLGEYLRVGGFGLYGKEKNIAGGGVDPYVNEAWMLGGDGTVEFGPLTLNLQYVERRDDNPAFLAPDSVGAKIETRGGFAELVVWPHGDQSKWYCAALYNKVDGDLDADDYESITGHAGYMLHTNLRLIVEDTYDIENEENRAVVGFVVGF